VEREYALSVTEPGERRYDLVVGAVQHQSYRDMDPGRLAALLAPGGTLADLKGMWRDRDLGQEVDRWTL
jgi:UDP-N-acetyl-D-galactosamine dehydrogenase